MVSRRGFFKSLLAAVVTVAAAPLEKLATAAVAIEPVPLPPQYEFTIFCVMKFVCDNPRRLGVITDITE